MESGFPVCVMSALRANIEFWKSIAALYFILSIFENGNKLPFASSPEPVKLRNNKSARLHAGFVDRVIYDYVYNLFLIFMTLFSPVVSAQLLRNPLWLIPYQYQYSHAVKRD